MENLPQLKWAQLDSLVFATTRTLATMAALEERGGNGEDTETGMESLRP